MISYGDMLDILEKNEPQKETTVAKNEGGDNTSEKKGGNNKPKTEEPKTEELKAEDVI